MLIIGIETTSPINSLAILEGGKTLAETSACGGISRSTLVMSGIEALLKKRGIKLKDIGAVAVSAGPGSFTGVRCGLAVAKGLSAGLGIPAAGVPTLDAMAMCFAAGTALDKEIYVCPVIDARKGEYYFAVYRCRKGKINKLSDYAVAKAEKIIEEIARFGGEASIIGDKGAWREQKGKFNVPQAATIALMGLEKIKTGKKGGALSLT